MDGSSENPFRLYRNTDTRWIAGVCAGIADYLGVGPGLVRVIAVACLALFFVPTALGYVVLALVLRPRPAALFRDRGEEAFWRGVATDPPETVQALRRKFRDLDERIMRMETLVTSEEFELRRGFRDLGR
ncbi:Envelope stress response membrane protein PspC [Rhodovastum atsumiense]|nr:envelope stress response membrane protein PspC [Rhodovastum atsumiense]CAH2600999.1 Envelope stress response membrane protein PspC [Rhodovastum atsumiense]